MTDVQQAQEFEREVAEATPPAAEDTIDDRKARAREMVPVTPGQGITPENYQGFVTVANGMAKAYLMLPPHLHDNVAVCIGIMDIAARAGLSAYLLGMQTYVQGGRLCFMSMAFHALAKPFLNGGLKGEYVGDGEELKLIIRGRLRGDPFIYEHESPPLKQVRPVRNESGVVKGSPLWDRKPRQQLWYDTTRDWVRRYCPQAVLGVRGDDEPDEPEMKDVTPPLRERLAATDRPATGEGFRDGAHVAGALAEASEVAVHRLEAAPRGEDDWHTRIEPAQVKARPSPAPRRPRPARPEPARAPGRSPAPKDPPARKTAQRPPQAREKAKLRKPTPPTAKQVKAAADRAEARAKTAPPAGPPAPPSPAAAYIAKTSAWIEQTSDPAHAQERWLMEHDDRDVARVPIVDRHRLKARLDEVCEELKRQRK
jgi:hypothetical protein